MRRLLGRVLVIDDDRLSNRIVVELLEKAGFSVVVRESSIGATQAIVKERIDAAVIDWNLPLLRGDEVVRLLRTWDEIKGLPVLLISGAPEETLERLRDELPEVAVLAKAQLGAQLVNALGSVISRGQTIRGLTPIDLGGKGEFSSAPAARPRSRDLVGQLLTELAEAMRATGAAFGEATHGKLEGVHALTQGLHLLAGRAHLLALEEASELLQALSETLSALPEDGVITIEEQRAIEGGIAALSALPRGVDGAFAIPTEPLIGALRRARSVRPPS